VNRLRIVALLLAALCLPACAREDPARTALRERLKQQPQLSSAELGRALDEVSASLEGKTVRFMMNGVEHQLNEEERDVVLGMLIRREGVFDEGLRPDPDTTLRIINAPGRSLDAENTATRRLLVDVETFLPQRFEFSYDIPDVGNYALDLVIE
jgi:hypothetical protein